MACRLREVIIFVANVALVYARWPLLYEGLVHTASRLRAVIVFA